MMAASSTMADDDPGGGGDVDPLHPLPPELAMACPPCPRLLPSRVVEGDDVILIAGDEEEIDDGAGAGLGPGVAGSVDHLTGKVGVVREITKRAALVEYIANRSNTYPPSTTYRGPIWVPKASCFDLRDAACRREYIAQRIARGLDLRRALRLGDEIVVEIGKHLIPHRQTLVVLSGYRDRVYPTVFARSCAGSGRGYWLQPSKLPGPRIDFALMSADPSSLILAGGMDDHPSNGRALRSCLRFDALTRAWGPLPDLRFRRHGCCGCVVGSVAYVFGGCYASSEDDEGLPGLLADAGNGNGGNGTAHAGAAVEGAADGDGGGDAVVGRVPFLERLELTDPRASWEPLWPVRPDTGRRDARMACSDRVFASCGLLRIGGRGGEGKEEGEEKGEGKGEGKGGGGRVMVVITGGEVPTATSSVRNRWNFQFTMRTVFEVTSTVELLCPRTLRWVRGPPMKEARKGAASCVVGGRLFVVGGGQNEHGQALRSVECFDGRRWRDLPPLNAARFHGAMVALNGVLTVVGGSDGRNFHSDVEQLTLPEGGDFWGVGESGGEGGGGVGGTGGEDGDVDGEGELRWIVRASLRMPIAFHACQAAAITACGWE